jgi:choice-of-anchor B domain-containing protein
MRKSCFLFLGLLFSLSPLFSQLSQNMNLLANWDDNTLPSRSGVYYNDIWGYAANGREYAILGTAVGTIFLDVTDPAQLFEIARFNGGYPNSLWRDFKTYRQYAYGVADETRSNQRSTLQIFDMSFLPFFVLKAYDSSTFFETAHNIFIDEPNGKLYAVGYQHPGQWGGRAGHRHKPYHSYSAGQCGAPRRLCPRHIRAKRYGLLLSRLEWPVYLRYA